MSVPIGAEYVTTAAVAGPWLPFGAARRSREQGNSRVWGHAVSIRGLLLPRLSLGGLCVRVFSPSVSMGWMGRRDGKRRAALRARGRFPQGWSLAATVLASACICVHLRFPVLPVPILSIRLRLGFGGRGPFIPSGFLRIGLPQGGVAAARMTSVQ
jgi:hypothetical protein